jgi:hypothetical protein
MLARMIELHKDNNGARGKAATKPWVWPMPGSSQLSKGICSRSESSKIEVRMVQSGNSTRSLSPLESFDGASMGHDFLS